jgi:hypothetical protein
MSTDAAEAGAMQRGERRELNEAEFFAFAKRHLSEAFPNPQRIDCPSDFELTRLAEHPKEADLFNFRHLTCCSPCFNRYMESLADLKRRRAGTESEHPH